MNDLIFVMKWSIPNYDMAKKHLSNQKLRTNNEMIILILRIQLEIQRPRKSTDDLDITLNCHF